jgi:MoaE-MoaD fusion protein
MNVRIRLFAALRDAVGAREITMEIRDGATINELKSRLGEAYPAVQVMLDRVVCAIDDEYVSPDEQIRAGAEVALIPPVSGGAEVSGRQQL